MQLDPSIEQRIADLMSEMTLQEKVGQMNQISFNDATGPQAKGKSAQQKYQEIRDGRVGSVLNVVGAEATRTVQRVAVEESRLGIPILFGQDVIHGEKTILPIPLADAASWDMAVIEKSARVAATEAAARGIHWTFAPMVDITRDARWGRVMEGAGEDPFLGSKIAIARVRGFQGNDLSALDTVAATLKHLAAYGFAEAGREYNSVEISQATLHNVVLPPFRDGVMEAGAVSVMNAFNLINGEPATASHYLQRELLKAQWAFAGIIVSDWASIAEMLGNDGASHGVARDLQSAAKLAVTAGSDIDMESAAYVAHLPDLVASGEIGEALITDAVHRILRVKFALGLFNDPFRYCDPAREARTIYHADHLAAARDCARKSIVLLKNDDALLPLPETGKKIAVIGALAADKDSPLGSWRLSADPGSAISVLEALQERGVAHEFAEGAALSIGPTAFSRDVDINETDRSGFDQARDLARRCDLVLMVLGENGFQSGEGRSRTRLGFPGLQHELLEAVHAENANIILVVMSGRPLVLTWAQENIPAIVQTWQLGTQSGHAICDVVFGDHNPSGKLPMTFPRHVGQVPIYYNQMNTGRPEHSTTTVFRSRYIDEENAPLYPFGYGLSYTHFSYADLSVQVTSAHVLVSVRIKNVGERSGEEVAQLYIRDRVAAVSRPIRELKGFEKLHLQPGESRLVSFELTKAELGYYDNQGAFRFDPGLFDIWVGGSSDASLSATIEITHWAD